MTKRDPFAPAPGVTNHWKGKGNLKGPRTTTPRTTPGGTAGPARHGVEGGHLAWSHVPGFPTLQWIQANVPPDIQQYDAVLVVGRNWDAFPTEGTMVAQFDWHGAHEDSAWTTQPGTYSVPPFGVPDELWTAWASVGLGYMLVDGPGDLELGGTHAWPALGGGGYPAGDAQYVVLAFHTAYHLIPFVGANADINFAGEGFWGGDFLGPVVPSWSWDVPSPNGLGEPYQSGYEPADGYARVVVAFTHTGEANHLTEATHQGWAVEFSDFDFVILSRPYADQMTVTLPAVAGPDCSVFVTSIWLAPGVGGGGAGTRPVGKLRGRPDGKRVRFDPKKRNPFA